MRCIAYIVFALTLAAPGCNSSSSTNLPTPPSRQGGINVETPGGDINVERQKKDGRGKLNIQTPGADVHIERKPGTGA